MPEPIFVIDETFFIKGRGLALLSFQNWDANPPVRVGAGDEIELATPDGKILRTLVREVELVHVDPPRPFELPLGILVSLPPEYVVRLRGAKARIITEK